MNRKVTLSAILVSVVLLISGCDGLPSEAERLLMTRFTAEERPHLISLKAIELTPQEVSEGVQEAWCANVAHVCWSCDRQEYMTCSSSWFVSLVGDNWEVAGVAGEDDMARWEELDCPVESQVLSMSAP